MTPEQRQGQVMIKAFSLASSPEPMFTIHMDGRVTFGPDYEPTEAAELFWSALTEHWKSNAELRAELDARDAAIAEVLSGLAEWDGSRGWKPKRLIDAARALEKLR